MPTPSRGHGTQQARGGCHAHATRGHARAAPIPPPLLSQRRSSLLLGFLLLRLLLLLLLFHVLLAAQPLLEPLDRRPDDRGGGLGGAFHLGHHPFGFWRRRAGFLGQALVEFLGAFHAGRAPHPGPVGSHRVVLWKESENCFPCYKSRPRAGPRSSCSPLQFRWLNVSLSRWSNPPTIPSETR